MSTHRLRVGQTIVVPFSGPQGAIPHGPYVVVRLLPLVDGEPHYRVRSEVDGHERALLEGQIRLFEDPGRRRPRFTGRRRAVLSGQAQRPTCRRATAVHRRTSQPAVPLLVCHRQAGADGRPRRRRGVGQLRGDCAGQENLRQAVRAGRAGPRRRRDGRAHRDASPFAGGAADDDREPHTGLGRAAGRQARGDGRAVDGGGRRAGDGGHRGHRDRCNRSRARRGPRSRT